MNKIEEMAKANQFYARNYNTAATGSPTVSPKSRTTALILCLFLGELGVHRFYTGNIGLGILYLFTLGLCGIGALVDFIILLSGSYHDGNDCPVLKW